MKPSAEENQQKDGHGKLTVVLEVVQEVDQVAEDPPEAPGSEPGDDPLDVRPADEHVGAELVRAQLPHHLDDHEQGAGHGNALGL